MLKLVAGAVLGTSLGFLHKSNQMWPKYSHSNVNDDNYWTLIQRSDNDYKFPHFMKSYGKCVKKEKLFMTCNLFKFPQQNLTKSMSVK